MLNTDLTDLPIDLTNRVEAALQGQRLQEARSLVFYWLKKYLQHLPNNPSRQQIRQPGLWRCLADVVERCNDNYLLELFWQGMDKVKLPPLLMDSALPLVGIPILNRPDLFEQLLTSLDYPDDTLAIVDNSSGTAAELEVKNFLDELETNGHRLINKIIVAKPFGNAGVAASWNLILRAFPSVAVAFLVNNDVKLRPDVLETALSRIKGSEPQFLPIIAPPQEFSAFFITASCWDRIGLFDQGFYPAYCEDLDYKERLRGDPSIIWPDAADLQAEMAKVNCDVSLTIASNADFKTRNQTSFALNRLWWLSHRRLRNDPRGTWIRQWLNEWKD